MNRPRHFFIADSSPAVRVQVEDRNGLRCDGGVMDQKEVLICSSHRSWHSRRTRHFLGQRSCDFDVIDSTDDAELGSWLAHYFFIEEGDRR